MEEARLAFENGYKILEFYEMYEYKVTRYGPATREGGLFAEYIDTLVKLIAVASGYPD